MFNTVECGFKWMVSFTNLEKKPDLSKRGYRLDKMIELLKIFNNPHLAYKTIHVAGSKGKGSTCGFLASILTEAGYKTGIYSSPHLLDYRERITNNHTFFSDKSYIKVLNRLREVIDSLDFSALPGGEPTTFELMTLAAFMIFREERCDWVVVETGIGGRIDSTNTVLPEASVITPIELEHTDLLGDTISKIAFEKAGIIKKERPVFTSNSNKEALDVILNQAKKMGSSLEILNKDFTCKIDSNGTCLNYRDKIYKIGLEGDIQGENALLALRTIKYVLPEISDEVIARGLRKTSIPGRFQVVNSSPKVVLDGAHTKNSVDSAVKTFKKIFRDGVVIFGAVTGKDITSMAEIISKNFETVIISTPGTFKSSDINKIEEIFNTLGKSVIKESSPVKALDQARAFKRPILVTGSFYMAGEVAKLI